MVPLVAALAHAPAPGALYNDVARRASEAGPIRNPGTFAWAMAPLVDALRLERAWLAHLDGEAKWMRLTELRRGDEDSVAVCYSRTCGDVAAEALAGDERYVLLAHNHPAGWAWPSEADAELTRLVASAMTARGLLLMDHVILSQDQHYSFREGQLWTTRR